MYRVLFLSIFLGVVSSFGKLNNFFFSIVYLCKKKSIIDQSCKQSLTRIRFYSQIDRNHPWSLIFFFFFKQLLTISHFCGWINFNILELIIKNKIPACFLAGRYNFDFLYFFFNCTVDYHYFLQQIKFRICLCAQQTN